jgi:hypothetical protein
MGEVSVPKYFIDVKDDHRLLDSRDLHCKDNRTAIEAALAMAPQFAAEGRKFSGRRLVIVDELGQEIGSVDAVDVEELSNMAVNKPVGDNARKGAVKKRSQVMTKLGGATAWTKRNKNNGEFMAVKKPARKTKAAKKFKGVRRGKAKKRAA